MAWITVTSTTDMDAQDIRDMVWSGARDRVDDLTDDQIDTIIGILADEYPDGIDKGSLNDFFWFEDDTYAEWLGYRNAEDLWSGHDSDYYDNAYYGIRITHGTSGVDDDQSVEDMLYDITQDINGEYEIYDDADEDYDDDTEKYTGSVRVSVSDSILDWLKDNNVSYEDT